MVKQKQQNQQVTELEIEVNKLLKKLANNCLSQIKLRDLVAPDGHAANIAKKLKKKQVKITQLRKLFNEIKNICVKVRDKKISLENAQTQLWLLYPKITYAKSRKLLPPELEKLFLKVLESVDNCNKPEDYEYLDHFFSALIAYAKAFGKAE